MKRGFTIFFAVLVASLALAIGLAILDLTLRQLQLSEVTSQSQYAIYAADTGAECALYWDNKCTFAGCTCTSYGGSSSCVTGTGFATSTASTHLPAPDSGMICQGQDLPTLWGTPTEAGSAATTTFIMSAAGSATGPCATVEVAKYVDAQGYPRTNVYSFGHNTCNTSAPNLVERELEVSY